MNYSPMKPPKRGWPAQRQQREEESVTRGRAVDFDRWAQRRGVGHDEAAAHLGLAPGTLADWERRWEEDHLAPQPLGRACHRSDRRSRNAAIDLMNTVGPRIGLPALRNAFPKMARGELDNLKLRFRRVWRRDNRYFGHVLHWHRPGSVWAMDHVDPPCAIDDRWPHLLAVRDLASGNQLLWLPVADETAQSTIAALESLFCQFGPPLVLKCDNGAGFIADETRVFLDRWQVWPLFSPPYTPQYNGGCEAGNGAHKVRTHEFAALAGRPGRWTADDAEAARRKGNEENYPWGCNGSTPDEVWRARPVTSEEDDAAFGRTVRQEQVRARNEEDYPLDVDLGRAAQAAIDRVAIRRALVEHGLLTFTRRSITPQLPTRKTPRIS